MNFKSILLIMFFAAIFMATTAYGACVTPTSGMFINENTTFCNGTYGNISTQITINANGVTLDCNSAELIGVLVFQGINIYDKEGVTIKNCVLRNFSYAIYVSGGGNNNILDNNMGSNFEGVVISNSTYNTISRNTAQTSSMRGMRIDDSSNNTIQNNTLANNEQPGMILQGASGNNTIIYNEIYNNNKEGILIKANESGNVVNHNNIHDNLGSELNNSVGSDLNAENNYWGITDEENIRDVVYDFTDDNLLGVVDFCPYLNAAYPGGGSVDCATGPGCVVPVNGTIINITQDTALCPGSYYAPDKIVISTDGITFDCNGAEAVGNLSDSGVYMQQRTGVTVKDCILNNFGEGISLVDSKNNIIINNTVSSSLEGVNVFNGDNNSILKNTISSNTWWGMRLRQTNHTTVESNMIIDNGWVGLEITPNSNNNTITYNDILNNGDFSILVRMGSADNIVNYNNIYGASIYELTNSQTPNANASYNYWGTDDEAEIQLMIYDQLDSSSFGKADYCPFYTDYGPGGDLVNCTGVPLVYINITSPVNGTTYTSSDVPVNATTLVNANCSFVLDNGNTTYYFSYGNETSFNMIHNYMLTGLGNSNHSVNVSCVNESNEGNNSKSVTFTVSVSADDGDGGGDTGGGGGDGGGGAGGNETEEECAEDWDCGGWSECSENGLRTRGCTDANSCGTYLTKPAVIESCTYHPPESEEPEAEEEETPVETVLETGYETGYEEKGGLFGITGAAIADFIGKNKAAGLIVLAILLLIGLSATYYFGFYEKKSEKKADKGDKKKQEK